MTSLFHIGSAGVAAFLASFVEGVEALTIVLAVGVTRGWRAALCGTGAALAALVLFVVLCGNALLRFPVPLRWLQLAVGLFLLAFGFKWLRKAVLRAAGRMPLHDEAAIYEKERNAFGGETHAVGFDGPGFAASFKAVLLEGFEVVLIIVAIGAAQASFAPAAWGAGAALALVVLLGLLLHRPLARVPENSLKFGVAVLLASFGIFWAGEGLGFGWPGGDAALPVLIAVVASAAVASVKNLARRASP